MFLSLSLSLYERYLQDTTNISPRLCCIWSGASMAFRISLSDEVMSLSSILVCLKHLIFQWLAKVVAVPSHGFLSVYLAATFLS
jgi:hypothetical protein